MNDILPPPMMRASKAREVFMHDECSEIPWTLHPALRTARFLDAQIYCETHYPAPICACGLYQLSWE
jgi:hypothetical protein